jgi:hypothetical protein
LIDRVQIAFPPEGVNFTHRSVLLLHGAAFSSQTWVDKVGELLPPEEPIHNFLF